MPCIVLDTVILYTLRKYIEFGCQTFQINSPDVGFVKVNVQFIYIFLCAQIREESVGVQWAYDTCRVSRDT